MKHFVVAMADMDDKQSLEVTNIFKDKVGWWHWINNFWLVIDTRDQLSCVSIRDELSKVAPGVRKIVLEVEPVTWAGAGPSTPPNDMFDWIKKSWETK
jgi:hypothetical protein